MRFSTSKTILFATLAVLLSFLICDDVFALPAAKDIGMKNIKPKESSESVEAFEQQDTSCQHNGGKFCEIICRNNPSEGGKMCNCDTYALKNKLERNCRYLDV